MRVKCYRCIFSMGMQKAMTYRADFFLSLISCVFPIIMQVYLWTALFKVGAADTNGYTYEQMILYTLLAGVTSRIVSTGFELDVAKDIKNGELSRYLVKPVNYGGYYFAQFIGGKVSAVLFLLIITAVVLTGSAVALGTVVEPLRVLLYIASLFLALILNFSIFFTIALLGFWLTEIGQLFGTISIVIMVISGGVFPLDIFGKVASTMASLLPFGYTTQFCVNIINGRLAIEAIGQGFVVQIVWISIFTALHVIMWSAGTKHYTAVGG